jgi:hypothetical protein
MCAPSLSDLDEFQHARLRRSSKVRLGSISRGAEAGISSSVPKASVLQLLHFVSFGVILHMLPVIGKIGTKPQYGISQCISHNPCHANEMVSN